MSGMFSSSLTRMIRIVLIVVYSSPGQIIIVHFQHVYSQVHTTVSFIFVSIILAIVFKVFFIFCILK